MERDTPFGIAIDVSRDVVVDIDIVAGVQEDVAVPIGKRGCSSTCIIGKCGNRLIYDDIGGGIDLYVSVRIAVVTNLGSHGGLHINEAGVRGDLNTAVSVIDSTR